MILDSHLRITRVFLMDKQIIKISLPFQSDCKLLEEFLVGTVGGTYGLFHLNFLDLGRVRYLYRCQYTGTVGRL